MNPADLDALEGEGLAYLEMGDAARGKQLLENSLSNAGLTRRSLVLNTALANLRTRNTIRTAKIIRDYLNQASDEDTRAGFAVARLGAGRCAGEEEPLFFRGGVVRHAI